MVIHAPEGAGPKDSKGRPVLKPVEFKETKVTRKGLIVGIGSVFLALIGAVVFRVMGGAPVWAVVAAAVLLAPPLVWAGYTTIRDQELEPFTGRELLVRVLVCAAGFALLWGLYWWLPPYLMDVNTITKVSPIMAGGSMLALLALGAFISLLAFDLEYVSGLMHCGLYIVATGGLALIAGVRLAAPF